MPYVITEACKNTKDRACVDVCPVDCIYEGADQLYIHPDECIDCGACEPECPVTAIFPEEDVPPNMVAYIEKNKEVFNSHARPGRPQRWAGRQAAGGRAKQQRGSNHSSPAVCYCFFASPFLHLHPDRLTAHKESGPGIELLGRDSGAPMWKENQRGR